MNLYEGMFLLDNDSVRAGWDQAKTLVTETLTKHGATVRTARRWAERKLAYPIKNHKRGTYLLVYFDGEPTTVSNATRDLDIREDVLRYLVLSVDAVPSGEEDLAAAEAAPDFIVPEPPADDEPDEPEPAPAEEKAKTDESAPAKADSEGADKEQADADEGDTAKTDKTEAGTAEGETASAPATETKTTEPAAAAAATGESSDKEGS